MGLILNSGHCLICSARAGDTVGDVEFEDGVEVDEGEVEVGFGLENGGGGGGVEGHESVDFWDLDSDWPLIGTAGAGDAIGDVELEDGVEIDEGEVQIGFGFEEGGGGGVEGHEVREGLRVLFGGLNRFLVEATGAGDAVGDVEFEDGVEIDEGEVQVGFGLENGG